MSAAVTRVSSAGPVNGIPRPVARTASPSTIGTASQPMYCGDPTLLATMSAVVKPSVRAGSRSAADVPRRAIRMPSTSTAPTATTSRGVASAAVAGTPAPCTW
ncbi:hypothetical protein [Pseudolysinimonas kribbensis]|uniref:hypothetical protein n=1 Tax=Pseudolysinimonas kribbensis TaxID=433641 RepID=UPI0024E0C145|nr:hypothetical protein [Pseudolysinimonas kribbensis]